MIIAILGALISVVIAIIGAALSIRGSIILQNRKLKEEHYVNYVESLHTLCAENSEQSIKNYTFARDRLFIVADEKVVNAILEYEKNGTGKAPELHDHYLTKLVLAIRNDLKIKDKNYPAILFKK